MDQRWLYIITSMVAAAGLGACSESGAPYYHRVGNADYPKPDPMMGEKLAKDEIQSAAQIAAIIEAHLRRLYPTGAIYRDAHPKADGCVRATFTVDPGLRASLKQGLFKEAGSYEAVIRFSNGNEDRLRSDYEGDVRGMAIKVYGLTERPITQDPRGPAAQDFVMISHPTFIVSDPTRYRTLISYADSKNEAAKLLAPLISLLSLGWIGTQNAVATASLQIDNPLNTRYWSVTPYQLGISPSAVPVKYSATPCMLRAVLSPDKADPNYLRHALSATLAHQGGGACMKFLVQPRTSAAMSVEDPRYEWPETAAPFYKVATVTFPEQNFDTPEQNNACEQLSYSPWHALPEHKPLGAINRMRKIIYERISAVRHSSPPPAEMPR